MSLPASKFSARRLARHNNSQTSRTPSLSPRLGYGVEVEGRRRTSRRRSHHSVCTASPFELVLPSTPSSSRILIEVARGALLGDGVDLAATFERSILATPRLSGRSQEHTACLKAPPR
ncbi:hypothetical protein ZEAMMB73_Zm00001d035560 [Zea mays]|uniref:Uncharacterized protein n=1 Tax=Zea mays TaxID=4577 RepID=A0A1D6LH88_MAIZE|nr:hypothetical protein ZEAMMB73_Zm00001d035560 [Zea mays]AQK79264.1 hypothetical protein ZEAMMB73_Zm00001d035560 [Zea mays]